MANELHIPPAKAWQRVRITVDGETVALFRWVPQEDGSLVAVEETE